MPKTSEDGGRNLQNISLDKNSIDELASRINSGQQRSSRRTKSEWRSLLALILVCGFLLIIGFVVISDQCWGGHTNAKDLLGSVGTLIASPLSFVIGYYYKSKD